MQTAQSALIHQFLASREEEKNRRKQRKGWRGKVREEKNESMGKCKGWEERHSKAVVFDSVVYELLQNDKILAQRAVELFVPLLLLWPSQARR